MTFDEFWTGAMLEGKSLSPLESKLACHLAWENAMAAAKELVYFSVVSKADEWAPKGEEIIRQVICRQERERIAKWLENENAISKQNGGNGCLDTSILADEIRRGT